jgi:hypothetical protein
VNGKNAFSNDFGMSAKIIIGLRPDKCVCFKLFEITYFSPHLSPHCSKMKLLFPIKDLKKISIAAINILTNPNK